MVNSLIIGAQKLMLLVLGLFFIFTGVFAQNKNDFDTYLQKRYVKGEFNGNVLIVKNDSVLLHKSYGVKSIIPLDTLTLNSVFRLGSFSKQFISMGIMVLKGQGELTLDQELSAFIPELSFYKGVTVRLLMNHLSGIPDYIHLMQ